VFEKASGGTLFLDEVGEIPLELQARLLRALEEKEVMRLGGDSIISVNVRIIAASNRDIYDMVKKGKFRDDLYYRLNIFQINLPPLRDHKSDIKMLIDHFLNNFGEKREINEEFMEFCYFYDWPGNVRELKNTIEYMLKIDDGPLRIGILPKYQRKKENFSFQNENGSRELVINILKELTEKGLGTGRRTIHDEFCKKYYKISEKEIREILKTLASENKIEIFSGRKGCRLK
jgi:transcriptional regulator with PAS, ATPase and Fis domain